MTVNDYQIDDLKQFISASIRNEIKEQLQQLEVVLSKRLNSLSKEMRDGFAGVGDAIEAHAKDGDEQLANHEDRIGNLEQAA
jgi:hypothetical protein